MGRDRITPPGTTGRLARRARFQKIAPATTPARHLPPVGEVAADQAEEVLEAATQQHKIAVHIGFAERQIRIERQTARDAQVAHPDFHLRRASGLAEVLQAAVADADAQSPVMDQGSQHSPEQRRLQSKRRAWASLSGRTDSHRVKAQ